MKKLMLFMLAALLGIVAANAQGTGTVVVANGTATNSNVPFYGLYANDNLQRIQTIYPESMLSEITGAEIQGITYYLNSAAINYNGTFELKMGICASASFASAAYDETTTLTTVYTGTFDCSSTEVTLNFSTNFTYTGGNLLIELTQTAMSSDYATSTFKGFAPEIAASVYGKNGTSIASITSPTTALFIPKTGFIIPVSCGTPSFGTIVPSETSAVIPINEPNSATRWSFKYNDGAWTTITDNPYTLTGLTANTDYTVYVRSICGDGDTSMTATATLHTTCAAESFPYSEDFEGHTASAVPDCWTSVAGTNTVVENGSYTTYAYEGTKALRITGGGTIVSPIINVAGNDVYVNFYAQRSSTSAGKLAIGFATSPATVAAAVYFDTIEPATTSTYAEYEFTFRNTLNIQSGCIVFKQLDCTYTYYYYYVDKLSVSEPPACPKPSGLTLDEATDRSLKLSWTENGSASKWVVKVGDEAWTETTENPYTINGLTTNTEYAVTVRAFCDPDTSDAISGTYRTLCAFETVPYSEDFEGITEGLPECWEQVASNSSEWDFSNAGNSGNGLVFGDWSGYNSRLILPVVNCSSLVADGQLSFSFKNPAISNGKFAHLALYYRTSLTGEWTAIDESSFAAANEDWTNVDVILPSSANAPYYQVSFLATGENTYPRVYAYLDDITIDEAPACVRPSNLTAAATDNSLTLSWTEAGSATKWVVKVGDGAWTETTENPYTINGLDANTEYAVSVRAFCDPDTSDAVNGTFRTLCGFEAVPYSEDFEGISSGLPDCWDQEASNAGRSKWDFSNAGNTGNCVFFEDYWAENSRLILPVVDCSSLATGAQMSFYFKNPLNSYSLNITYDVYYRTSSTGEWTIISDASVTDANADWTIAEFILPNSANAAYYQVSILATGADTYTKPALYIDDIYIGIPASCARPSNLTAEAAETSLTLSWNENGSATKWVVKVGDGAWTETTQNPYTINDLTANTEYAVSVRAFCNPDTSEAVSGTFRTLCGVFTSTDLPYFEGFEGEISCWEQENINGNTMWEVDGLYSYYDATAYEGAEYYGINGDGAETRLISPVFNLAGIDNVTLKLAHVQPSYYGYYQDNLTIEYRLSSTGEWQTLATYTDDITEWQSESFDIPNPGATFQFAFRAQLNDANGVGIDSVSLSSGSAPQPTCDVPTALAAGNVTANSAVISWTGSAAQYEVEFNGQSSTVNTNSYTAQGLTAATAYAVRVRALCDGGLTSDWTSMVNFTTLDNGGEQPGDCGVPTNVAVSNVTTNSAVVTWDAPVESETFEGEWNLVMGQNDSVHTTITLNQTLHTILGMLGQDIADVDENVSVAGTQVPVTIEQGAGNQMNISGNFDMMMYGVDEPVTFHFSTTGTVTENGMNIEPANISESVAIMGTMNIDYTGTVTFEQPTELPEGGVLTIGIASMNITGYGDTVIYGQTGTVNISMTASDIEATGMRAGAGNSEPTYEVMITNTASGVENTYASATRTYSAEGLTAATAYTAKVRTVCGEGNYSEWSAAVPFTTLNGDTPVECDVPTNIVIDQESINTPYAALITWNGTASQYEIEITGGEQPVTTTVSTNSYTFNGVASTTYSVRVRAICDGGVTSDWSATQSFTTPNGGEPQGIDDVNASYSVSVYPNPATNHVTVSVEGLTGKAQVSVVDMTGRTVMSSAMEGDAMQLNVTKLAQGTYFVRINGENISTVRKLVVR